MSDESIGADGVQGPPDRALLAAVSELLDRVDPPPTWMVDLAKLSFDLRGIDAELAELVADSRVDDPVVAVRSIATATQPRLLTFENEDRVVEVELTAHPTGGYSLMGQLLPAGAELVEVRQPDRSAIQVPVDELGRFAVDQLAAVPFSLVCRWSDGRSVVSQWVTPD